MRGYLLAAALLLAGCDTYYVADYRERFPISVHRQTPVLLVSFPVNRAELGGEEVARLDGFIAEYLSRSSGPLQIGVKRAGPADRLAVERIAAIENRVVAAGVPKSLVEARLVDGAGGAGDAVISFERYTAQVPECGDWTKNTMVDWTNTPSSNFGCSTQRYVGLMAADPKDLLGSRGLGTHDAQRMSDQLAKYRIGKPTIAEPQESTNWTRFFDQAVGAGGAD